MMKQVMDALLVFSITALFRAMGVGVIGLAHQCGGVLKSMDLAYLVQHRMQQH